MLSASVDGLMTEFYFCLDSDLICLGGSIAVRAPSVHI